MEDNAGLGRRKTSLEVLKEARCGRLLPLAWDDPAVKNAIVLDVKGMHKM